MFFRIGGGDFPELDVGFDIDLHLFEFWVFAEGESEEFFTIVESGDFIDGILDHGIELLTLVVIGLGLFVVAKTDRQSQQQVERANASLFKFLVNSKIKLQ